MSSTGFSPRRRPNYPLYVSATGTSESIGTLQSNERMRGAVLGTENQKTSMRQTSRVDQVFWLVSGGRQTARICDP